MSITYLLSKNTPPVSSRIYYKIPGTPDTIRCPEGLHKLMTFQHGCLHHCGPPGRMYFLNTSITMYIIPNAVADPEFPVRGRGPVRVAWTSGAGTFC